jgi:hypothetical protein
MHISINIIHINTGNLILMGLAFYMYRRSQAEAVKISEKMTAAAAPTA